MYLLNKWYMAACERGEAFVPVRVRNQHYFCGDDVIYVEFLELHQLCHLDSLDKSLISCYSLVEKRAVLSVLSPLQSRFWNREHESRTKEPLL